MRCHELAIKQRKMTYLQACHQPGQRDLRGIGHPAEHRLSEECAAQLHAIKAANQLFVVPAFDRVSLADGMQSKSRPLDYRINPGFLSVRAGEQDFVERPVPRYGESARPDALAKRA
jgi:hypothetical protein